MARREIIFMLFAAHVLSGCDAMEKIRIRHLVKDELRLSSADGFSIVRVDDWGFANHGGDVSLIKLDRATCTKVAASLPHPTPINEQSFYYKLYQDQGLTTRIVREKGFVNTHGLGVNYALDESTCFLSRECSYD
jgi:hypothetical protein